MGTWIIGVDPGVGGAIALLSDCGKLLMLSKPPLIQEIKSDKVRNKMNLPQLIVMLKELITHAENTGGPSTRVVVYMEQVSSRPTDGGIQAFTFGKNVGHWEGLIAALQLPYNSVPPPTWKKEMVAKTVALPKLPEHMSKKQKSKVSREVTKARKFAAVEAANRMFPSMSAWFTKSEGDGPAEAALIAEWGRRRENAAPIPKLKAEKIIIAVPEVIPEPEPE